MDRAQFRAKVRELHPDHGGDPAAFNEFVTRYREAGRVTSPVVVRQPRRFRKKFRSFAKRWRRFRRRHHIHLV